MRAKIYFDGKDGYGLPCPVVRTSGGAASVSVTVTPSAQSPAFSLPALTVVPTSWDPLSLPSLQGWYRADTLVESGGAVSDWTDKSGNGLTLSQADEAKRPDLLAAELNGHPVVKSGASKFLVSGNTTWTCPFHIFAVMRADDFDANNYVLMMQGDGTLKALIYWWEDPYILNAWCGVNISNTADAPAEGSWALVEILAEEGANAATVIIGGGTPATGTLFPWQLSPTADNPFSLFARTDGTNPGRYTVADLILSSAEVTGSDLTKLRTYASTRYAL